MGTEKKPQISPLRCAPVEMTILFEGKIPRFQEKQGSLAATELSSRSERSAVERSAVSFRSHADSLALVICGFFGTTGSRALIQNPSIRGPKGPDVSAFIP
jgi:hypothetical protein